MYPEGNDGRELGTWFPTSSLQGHSNHYSEAMIQKKVGGAWEKDRDANVRRAWKHFGARRMGKEGGEGRGWTVEAHWRGGQWSTVRRVPIENATHPVKRTTTQLTS